MKIKKVDIPKSEDNHDGLGHIKMEKLDNIVLIAGKNGSGKTRILNKIFGVISSKPTKSFIANTKIQLENEKRNLTLYETNLGNLNKQLSIASNELHIDQLKRDIADSIRFGESSKQQILNMDRQLNWKQIETSDLADSYSAVRVVPKSLALQDSNSFPKNQMMGYAANISSVGVDNLPQGSFAKIQVIQDRWFNSTHQHSQVSQEEKKKAVEEYEKLQKIIDIFLNTPIGRTINDEATLFGFPMGQSNLSDGQKILLQFCLAIYSQETALKDLILILDEPENHLHPSVIIETIERIQKCVSNGQIWIATHSVPLLAHFNPSQIWFVENGKIQHAGKIPEKVLNSLLGDESEVAKLQDFISLPAQYASSRYAFESLIEPGAIMTDSTDSQSMQVRADLLKLASLGKLRILDYGAGKGRLISNITDLDSVNADKLIQSIDYITFDKYPTDKDICESALSKAYGSSENRYFNDMNRLLSVYNKASFHVVIMCNVFHEIDPKDWLKLFQPEGIISGLLAENGILLLVEDHQIPIGEKAYQKGFLVLDTPHLKDLFKISEEEIGFTFSEKKGGRLKAHQIPKNYLIRIDEASRLAAIRSMSITSREKIIETREKEVNYQNGKLHGFWTQQFANAQLNISELSIK